MISFLIRGNKEVEKKLNDMKNNAPNYLGGDIKKACYLIEQEVKLAVSAQRDLPIISHWGPRAQPRLHVRTGRLRSSYTSRVEKRGREIIGRVGSGIKYARIHEVGGEIKPKTKPYLVFPIRIPGVLTARGKLKERRQWVRTKLVRMPGRAPLTTSALRKREEIVRMFDIDCGKFVDNPGVWRSL